MAKVKKPPQSADAGKIDNADLTAAFESWESKEKAAHAATIQTAAALQQLAAAVTCIAEDFSPMREALTRIASSLEKIESLGDDVPQGLETLGIRMGEVATALEKLTASNADAT